MILSEEQHDIINSNNNVIINAVAGSGKSTTILHYAQKYQEKNIIQLTYNAMLKVEILSKATKIGIKNMKIHTYHSLVTNYYDNSAYDDEHIKKVLLRNTPLKNSVPKIDVLLIDEVQDMTFDYFNIVKKFIKDTESDPLILLFGDHQQCIYQFKNATSQFLTLADNIWARKFNYLSLSTSYRLTDQIAWFINKCMIKYDKINTCKSGPKVDYYITNTFTIYRKLGNQIVNMIENEGYSEDDFFILIPSVKSENSPYKKLENYLVGKGLKCMTPVSDDVKLDEQVIKNKIIFTTYHQSKGRERRVVIVYNFDNSYFLYFDKTLNSSICPNILYVVCSRAKERLILVQDERHMPLRFLDLDVPDIKKHVNIIKTSKNKALAPKEIEKETKFIKKSVSELVKFISPSAVDDIILLMKDLFEDITIQKNPVNIKSKIETSKDVFEDVSDLNGLVIASLFERLNSNTITTIEYYVKINMEYNSQIEKYVKNLIVPCQSISDFLRLGNVYTALQNNLHSKIAQIKKYDWLSENDVKECLKNLDFIKDKNLLFEYKLTNNDSEDELFYIFEHDIFGEIRISARVDAFDDENIYEFKCVQSLSLDHKLQIILYYWLWHQSGMKMSYGNRNGVLINIRTGEIFRLKKNDYIINEIVNTIFMDKFTNRNFLTDQEFIVACNK